MADNKNKAIFNQFFHPHIKDKNYLLVVLDLSR